MLWACAVVMYSMETCGVSVCICPWDLRSGDGSGDVSGGMISEVSSNEHTTSMVLSSCKHESMLYVLESMLIPMMLQGS